MFENIGWGEVLILVVAGLFILGPERLPSAAAWLGKAVRQVKDYASGAREQLRSELGPEFDELRKPLEDLRGIRNFDPRSAVTKHLFDGENPLDGLSGNGNQQSWTRPLDRGDPEPAPSNTGSAHRSSGDQRPLEQGERPPYDPDAT